MARYLLALDQGSQSSRAIVYTARGELVAEARRKVGTQRLSDGRVEQDPSELLESLQACIADVALQVDPARIVSAGMATQRSSIVCWRRDTGTALTPVLSWQDRRADEWLAQFSGTATRVREITGLPLSPHYGASKLNWCLHQVAEVRRSLADETLVAGPLSSYLAFRLLREQPVIADPANASRTLLFDAANLNWSAELCELFGVPATVLPAPGYTKMRFGTLNVADHDVPFEVLTGDQSAALFAFGAPESTSVYCNLGTGAFLQRSVPGSPAALPGLLSSVVFADDGVAMYSQEGTVNGAGSALATVCHELGVDQSVVEQQLPGWLDSEQEPPLFLNGVAGLGSPWWQADFPTRFEGEGDVPARFVAVIESIVFLLQANLEVLESGGLPAQQWVVTGGLSRLSGLCQRLANLSGLPVICPPATEATALGVARLLAGRGDWGDTADVRYSPVAHPALRKRYSRWRRAMLSEMNPD